MANNKQQDKQTSSSLENIYVSPGVRESWDENRSALLLNVVIIVVILLVIAVGHTGA